MKEQNQGVTPSGPGSQASPEAADASSPSVSIPNADGLKFCKDCRYIKAPLSGSPVRRGADCHHPLSYQSGDFDLETGADCRQWRSCADMRSIGGCGRSAVLFENMREYTTRVMRQQYALQPSYASAMSAQRDETRSGSGAKPRQRGARSADVQ